MAELPIGRKPAKVRNDDKIITLLPCYQHW